ncbi:MAG: protein kinase domain-containing protein [Polyangiales bacterium]
MIRLPTAAVAALRARLRERGVKASIIAPPPEGDPCDAALAREYGPLCEAMYLVMAADGTLASEERDVIRGALRELDDRIRSRHVETMLREAHEALARDGWDARLAALAEKIGDDKVRAEAAILLGAAVAYADGVVADEENHVMSLLMAALHVDSSRLAELIASLEHVDLLMIGNTTADAADLVLHAAMRLHAPEDLESLAATSGQRADLALVLRLYASFVRSGEELLERSAITPKSISAARIAALRSFAESLPEGPSRPLDDLRLAFGRLSGALESVDRTTSLRMMVDPMQSPPPIVTMELALARVAQMVTRAERRLGQQRELTPIPGDLRPVIESVLEGKPGAREALEQAIARIVAWSARAIPGPLSATVDHALRGLATLPVERPSASPPTAGNAEAPLPEWVPSRRTIGGFYLQRPLGSGSTASVFVVCRAEDRDEKDPQRFALKVPQFDAVAAQSVSEAEFLALFREEAGALLALPEHPNLAGFVTFDARARPKPILVMELVEGIDCETLLAKRQMSVPRALSILDGVLAGLIAMHARGIGHLDLKPSNVVLRGGAEPVLVDFGLSGRKIRPWCATPPYAAPEIWGRASAHATPLTADVYAFGCLAWELLTGRQLFDGPNATTLMQAHIAHDGGPAAVRKLVKDSTRRELATAISACLRMNPDARPAVETLRLEFKRIAATTALGWPIV